MNSDNIHNEQKESKLSLLNTTVLVSTPVLAAILVPLYWNSFTAMDWVWFAVFMVFAGLGITGGYHRLWSHKAYEASLPVRIFYAYWGACAGQNSILKWSADHRDHHKYVDDNEKDPYSAKKGFWWSHIGWILYFSDEHDLKNCKDLKNDKVVMWQHNNYLVITLISNFAVPILLGWAHMAITGTGTLMGTFILAGLLRFVLNHHFTFLINSACHFFGSQPYSDKDTSRDNFLLALVTYGEGYHNYHHTFQADYRNGIKWHHFDPTKWFVKSLNYVGLTSNLKKVSDNQILKQKTLHAMTRNKQDFYERFKIITGSSAYQKIESNFNDFIKTMNEWVEAKQRYFRMCKDGKATSEDKKSLEALLNELKTAYETKKEELMEIFKSNSTSALVAA